MSPKMSALQIVIHLAFIMVKKGLENGISSSALGSSRRLRQASSRRRPHTSWSLVPASKYCREPIVSRALRPPDSAMNCCPGNRGSGGAQIRNHVSFGRSADGAMPWDEPGHGMSPGPVKDFGEGDIASGKLPPAGGVMVRL